MALKEQVRYARERTKAAFDTWREAMDEVVFGGVSQEVYYAAMRDYFYELQYLDMLEGEYFKCHVSIFY